MNKLIILTLLVLVSCDNMCHYANVVLPRETIRSIVIKYNDCMRKQKSTLLLCPYLSQILASDVPGDRFSTISRRNIIMGKVDNDDNHGINKLCYKKS